jgi:hypothetical protein
MLIRMTRPRVMQEAGAERLLNCGAEYNLPDVVALSLIATAAAVPVGGRARRAPETKAGGELEPGGDE